MYRRTSRRHRRNLAYIATSALLSAGIGMVYANGVHDAPLANGALVGLIFGALVPVFLLEVAPRLRRVSLALAVLLKTLALTAMMVVGLSAGMLVFGDTKSAGLFDPRSLLSYWSSPAWPGDFAFMFALAGAANLLFSMQDLIGPWTFWQFLLGRYHRPREERRIFMFLDLADSTAAAEQLGDIRFYTLLQQLVDDVTPVIADHDGRIDRYLGDAVVVTWPHSGGPADRRCLDCFFAVDDLLAARAEAYRQRFGLTPRYRAGIHGGHVVTGEIGRQRKEILFLGDTVNTAARIEEAAKAMGRRLLVTGAVLDGLAPDGTFCAEALGPFTPRGRQGAVPLYAVERAPT